MIERFKGSRPEPLKTLSRDAAYTPKDLNKAVLTAPTPLYRALLEAAPTGGEP